MELQSAVKGVAELLYGDPEKMIKMSRDLVFITKHLFEMNQRVSREYDELTEREGSLFTGLTVEQLRQVHEWVRENEEASASSD